MCVCRQGRVTCVGKGVGTWTCVQGDGLVATLAFYFDASAKRSLAPEIPVAPYNRMAL